MIIDELFRGDLEELDFMQFMMVYGSNQTIITTININNHLNF